MAIRLLHSGDWHIGRFPGPETDGQNQRFLDICRCLDALVAGARAEKPDAAVIAGDVFHQAKTWSDRGLSEVQTAIGYIRQIAEVCPVVVMRGTPNHDGESHFDMLKTAFDGDGNVHIITEPQVVHVYTGRCGWVQIACLPGFDKGYFRAKHPGLSKEEENEAFTKSIEDMIIGLKAQCKADYGPAVLASHYTITGCNMESGQTAFFSQFEPVVYPSTLAAADFDLVCFGHIHRPQKIEGCRNTYYCGAVSALNFNDEAQKRGFYIHDIDKDTRAVTSEFVELPTREYLTIRLDDGDIREINEGGPDWLFRLPVLNGGDEARDKIVRVLYDCTDEHNKAFNDAVLRNWLRETAGAFWVQEVTPQKISITADRRGMDADSSPEENLGSYLAEKEIAPERIGELIELAGPIIAEAAEKATAERHTGLFVPVEIEVKNYRNYREESFSFEDIRFCTINGSNGAGKSSLFMDAIMDALYEEPREGELTGWICSDPDARSGAIKFTFRLGESLYRVTRTRQKSGKATLNIAEFVDGEWTDRSKEKFKDTQQEIINIIGMDSLTFKACALIMQDQYGLFLQADKEARMNILGSILGLGIYDRMEELAAEKAADANRAIRTLADKTEAVTAGLPDRAELAAQIEAKEAERQQLEEQAARKTAEADVLKVKLNMQLEAAARVAKLNSKIAALTAQKASKESAKTSQSGIMSAADTILEREAEIAAGAAEYNVLMEQEKELIKGKASYDSLAARKKQIEGSVELAESSAEEMRKKKSAITLMKICPLRESVAKAAELTAKHEEYLETVRRIAELEALAPDYEAKKAAVQGARAEAERLDLEYKTARERLTLRLDALKKKVELLNDSGCPDVEKASCRFLADALEAKKILPEAEAALSSLDTEHENDRQTASDSLAAAEKELNDSLYHPEEIDAFRGNLKLLEAAEKEYAALEGQRSELKLLEERAAELEERMKDAEAAAEKGRAELSGIEAQLSEAEAANADYGRLQQQIAAARRWLDEEKQLPIARERKKTAAERVLELTAEIESIETDISEAQTELAEEQDKTIGKWELQIQVDAAEAQVKSLQDAARSAAMTLGGLKEQAEQAEKKLAEAAELQKQMNGLGVKAAGYEALKKAFSQDGVPHNIIRSIIPVFEAAATNILGQMSQGHMSVEFVMEKTLKSNSRKEVTTLDIIVNDSDTGRLPYMSRSGGEKVKAALSVILALSEIKSSKAGVQLGFLFIDEPPFLDQHGAQAYCDALETIQGRYSSIKIMAITHDPTMKARFPQNLDVVKTENGSKVIY